MKDKIDMTELYKNTQKFNWLEQYELMKDMRADDFYRLDENRMKEFMKDSPFPIIQKARERARVLKEHFPDDDIPDEIWLSQQEIADFLTKLKAQKKKFSYYDSLLPL